MQIVSRDATILPANVLTLAEIDDIVAPLLSRELEGGEMTWIEWATEHTYNQARYGPGGVFVVPEGVKSVWVTAIGGGGGGLVRGNTPWEQFLHHQRLVAVEPGERLIVVAK